MCIINPGNPTGKVLTRDEMKLIVDIALENDLFIIADEVYRGIRIRRKRNDHLRFLQRSRAECDHR